MTLTPTKSPSSRATVRFWKRFGACYMCLFLILLFFRNANAASLWVSEGLELCAKRLIPSLFPFMVISSLTVSSGVGRYIFKLLERPFGFLFGIRAEGVCAIALGWLCGFPVGAKCAVELYDGGKIGLSEYRRIVCISSTPSPAFLIGALGSSMLGSARSGVILYAASIFVATVLGIALNLLTKKDQTLTSIAVSDAKRPSFAEALTRAVGESAIDMLRVCAFVVFFSAFLGAIQQTLACFSLSETVAALIFAFFELTTGTAKLCEVTGSYAPALCALAVGWSGLSVHFQTMSICGSRDFQFKQYFLFHAVRATLCLIIGFLVF